MSLIAMAVHDTVENKRSDYTRQTLESLDATVDWSKHRLFVIDNNSCDETKSLFVEWSIERPMPMWTCISLPENIGTARAINKAWALRNPGEHCIKMDNDVVIHNSGWVDEMEEYIANDPNIGQIGLKRKDCWEWPGHDNPDYKSELYQLPHTPGDKWRIVEKQKHVMGTCVMHNSALLDKVGYLWQPSLYGYDDVIMSHRSILAGFYNCMMPHVNIDHIDTGQTEYQGWKERHAGEQTQLVIDTVHQMIRGERSLYYDAN